MTDTSIATTQQDNTTSLFDTILDLIGQGQTLWSVLTFIAFLVAFAFCIVWFRSKVNRISKKQIDEFIKVKKYAPSLYVELNDNMEQLRYFVFSSRWKWRIVRRYNLMFRGYVGKQLKNAYKNEICYKISYFSKFDTVKNTIIKTNKTLNDFRNDRKNKRQELEEFYFVVQNLSYDCIKTTEQLLSYCSKMESKNMIVVGSAGNGKTSLLCRATEMAIKYKYPCLMLNSRDIENKNVVDYISEKLPLVWRVNNHPLWFLRIMNFVLHFSRKYLFIIIDAVNENDSSEFLKSIGSVNDYFHGFSRVKILLSCRSEYFDCRYKKLFDSSKHHPDIFQLSTTDYDERAVKMFFSKYSNHYNVPRIFSANVKNKISKSLFLLKIFFEVNSGRPHDNLEFQNAEIYKQYIDKVALEHLDIDVHQLINQISSLMINQKRYDKVDLSELNLTVDEKTSLFNMLDNNLIISKTIELGVGISERTAEYLYFVFDEFRDFCIARELIIRGEDNEDPQYAGYFDTVTHMNKNVMAPLEGILKYGYYHFKKIRRLDLSEKIISVYGKSDVQHVTYFPRYHREKTYYFDDFGLSLIYMDARVLDNFEENYIRNSIRESVRSNVQVMFFLLNNEIVSEKPDLHQYLNIVLKESDEEIISMLIRKLVEQEKYYNDSKELINTLYDRIDFSSSYNGQISDNIKMLLVLIFSFETSEWYWKNNGDPIEFDDSLYDSIINETNCETLKKRVEALKNHNSRTILKNTESISKLIGKYYEKK